MTEIENFDINLKQNSKKRQRSSQGIRHHKKKKHDSNIPSSEELDNLREAETVFHSSFFKLQVDELLKEIKITDNNKLKKWIGELKEFLQEIPESSQCAIDEFTLDASTAIPIIQNPKSEKGVFKFVAPDRVMEIGSFVLDTVCSCKPVVDIAIEIPKACWQSMDYLNYRYHRKRAFYLSYIASFVTKSNLTSEIKYSYQNDCYLKPVLLIIPKDIVNVTVSVTAYPVEEAFKPSRFIPARNNVRSSWLFGSEIENNSPTPFYNATILADLMLVKFQDYLEKKIISKNIKDGLILVKLWCIQRQLSGGYGRLNGFIVSMFVSYLLAKRKISELMNAYQVFRCTLLAFRNEDFVQQGVSMADETNTQPSLEDFKKMYEVVFLDSSGFFNLCYYVTIETMLMIKHEAYLALQILDSRSPNCFSMLFMNKITFSKKFEYLVHIKGQKAFKRFCKKLDVTQEALDLGENQIAAVLPKICKILRKGLKNRILLLDSRKTLHSPWPISDPPPNPNTSRVTIGILLNPEVPLSNLEKGPPADDPKAKEFRDFWGDQSEMRRFQDGSIRESVFWPAVTIGDKRKVFSQIIKDILNRHINADEKCVFVVGTEVDSLLHLPKNFCSDTLPQYGTGEEAHVTLLQSFNELSKQLRSLDGLPLLIASVQGISPSFHFCEVFPPLSASYVPNNNEVYVSEHVMKIKQKALKVPTYIPALKAVISFEGSGKWPDSLDAIKRVKAAFLIKIAELIKAKFSLVTIPFLTHVDIFKEGFVFRLEIVCHKELFLMKQVHMLNGITRMKETSKTINLEMTFDILPKLNSMLHGLQQQHNTFGTACRLAKRWVSAQMKHGYVHDMAVELIMAYIYIHPEPYTLPSSPQLAFIRFLSLIVSYDWKTCPLILNLNNDLQIEEIDEIHSQFTSQRSVLPPMVIVTPFDKRGTMWTKKQPIYLILNRLIILAKRSLKKLEKSLYTPKNTDVKVLFRPPLGCFDVLIYLKHNEIAKLHYAVDVNETDELSLTLPFKDGSNDKVYPAVDFDPVQKYLKELKENFGEIACFFYDVYGGDFIAVMWKQSAFAPKEFKVSHANYRTVYRDGISVIPDVEVILEDFELLGSGLVKEIKTQTKRWQLP